jgi:hypothetical protein
MKSDHKIRGEARAKIEPRSKWADLLKISARAVATDNPDNGRLRRIGGSALPQKKSSGRQDILRGRVGLLATLARLAIPAPRLLAMRSYLPADLRISESRSTFPPCGKDAKGYPGAWGQSPRMPARAPPG